ncbi:hypothetical protein F4778DRAFT_782582 [Xylariomycetidae sp. FL2044]|nr:hypothetical protein F4778DRAFT_782582 [Xylariomycetidae sp. FL2044]
MPHKAAKEEVLGLPELLEAILLHVDMQSLLTATQRVCRHWYTAIAQSPALQRHLFFLPDPKAIPKHNPLLAKCFPFWFQHATNPEGPLSAISISYKILANDHIDTQPFPTMPWLLDNIEIYRRPGATWRELLVHQPPFYSMGSVRTDHYRQLVDTHPTSQRFINEDRKNLNGPLRIQRLLKETMMHVHVYPHMHPFVHFDLDVESDDDGNDVANQDEGDQQPTNNQEDNGIHNQNEQAGGEHPGNVQDSDQAHENKDGGDAIQGQSHAHGAEAQTHTHTHVHEEDPVEQQSNTGQVPQQHEVGNSATVTVRGQRVQEHKDNVQREPTIGERIANGNLPDRSDLDHQHEAASQTPMASNREVSAQADSLAEQTARGGNTPGHPDNKQEDNARAERHIREDGAPPQPDSNNGDHARVDQSHSESLISDNASEHNHEGESHGDNNKTTEDNHSGRCIVVSSSFRVLYHELPGDVRRLDHASDAKPEDGPGTNQELPAAENETRKLEQTVFDAFRDEMDQHGLVIHTDMCLHTRGGWSRKVLVMNAILTPQKANADEEKAYLWFLRELLRNWYKVNVPKSHVSSEHRDVATEEGEEGNEEAPVGTGENAEGNAEDVEENAGEEACKDAGGEIVGDRGQQAEEDAGENGTEKAGKNTVQTSGGHAEKNAADKKGSI